MARLARITGGFTLVIAGLFMLVLPGPGIVTIIGGLALLARDLPWARRLELWARGKVTDYGGKTEPDLTDNAGETS